MTARLVLGAMIAAVWALGDARPGHAAQNADEFLVVDCLLPGKVKKLGRRVTFVTARRAVKTSASDCEIRGGEYTAEDRASYTTALKTWLPVAKQGDPLAQTYVGEIYEKGLGVPPQFKLAAQWYQKAVDQGFTRAMTNLGALYERGDGVAQDKRKAVELYRRAAGFDASDLAFVPGDASAELAELRAEREALRAEREALQRERDDLKQQLDEIRRRLEGREGELEQRSNDAQAAQAALRAVEAKLQEEVAAGRSDQVLALSKKLAEKTVELNLRQGEVDKLRGGLGELQQQAAVLRQDLAASSQDRDAEIARYKAEAAAARQELSQLGGRLAAAEQTLRVQRQRAQARADEVGRLQADLAKRRQSANRDRNREQELERALKEREAALAEERDRAAALETSVSELQGEAEDLRLANEEILALMMPAAGGPPEIEIIEPAIPATRSGAVEIETAVQERLIVGRVLVGAELMALTINDVEQSVGPDGMFRTKMALPTEVTPVTVVAVDSQGQRSTVNFSIRRPNAPKADPLLALREELNFGRYRALVIGNVDYQFLPRLKTAVRDAKAVAEVLETRYGFDVELLIDANRYDILSALNKLRAEMDEDDNLLIYYAGHGELDRVNDRGNWLPVDAEPDSSANWISNIQVTDVLNAMAARQVMVVADSCYSGTLTRSVVAQLDAGMTDSKRASWIKLMAGKRSRVVLSSGGVQPVLDAGGGDHSVFAAAFLAELRENDHIMEGQKLFRGVAQRVTSVDAAQAIEQLPQYAPIKYAGHEAGDFFFVPMLN